MFKLFLVLLFGITLAYADYPIHPNQIPEKSKQFLSQHFKQDVTFAKKDSWEYEVYLQDGTRVEFTNFGNFKEAKGYNLPKTMLPVSVQDTIQKQFQGHYLTKIEVDLFGFEIEFNDYLKIKINPSGYILYQEID